MDHLFSKYVFTYVRNYIISIIIHECISFYLLLNLIIANILFQYNFVNKLFL